VCLDSCSKNGAGIVIAVSSQGSGTPGADGVGYTATGGIGLTGVGSTGGLGFGLSFPKRLHRILATY